jgi:NAD(P)-dependent dehydrogenase (short-subunit alcohol dehydrogenase family)
MRLFQIGGIAGKHVLVTGAAGLLASEICLGLAENRAKLSMIDIVPEKLNALQIRLMNLGVDTFVAPSANFLDAKELASTLDLIESRLGTIDVLIHAAYPRTSDWHVKLEEIPFASWQKNVDMHLNGTFLLCQEIGKRMSSRNTGNIILFSSIYGLVAPDFNIYNGLENMTMPAAYSAIKGGISNFARYLASYWGKCGIRVNAICPGGVFNHQEPNFVERYVARVPMRRMGSPQDIAGVVLFLASDLSSYVNGVNLPVDGGWTAL